MTKECFKCRRVLPVDEFYPHSKMADGRLNKCKSCTRCDTIQNRRKHAEYYREYDRARSSSRTDRQSARKCWRDRLPMNPKN